MAFGTERETDTDPEVEEREDADREPRSHEELRRNWQRLTRPGGRGRGAGSAGAGVPGGGGGRESRVVGERAQDREQWQTC